MNFSKTKLQHILKTLDRLYPDLICFLTHETPFQLLVSTILSAQCTDARVNQVTPALFQAYPNPQKMASASLESIEKLIRSTGFYKNKAKNIQGAARVLLEKFDGEVPQSMEDLIQVPGVGRKTANVVLGNCFGKAAGVVVDTHVKRISYRLGMTQNKSPEKIEIDLVKIIPQARWTEFPLQIIEHGRQICKAQRPLCDRCELAKWCERRGVS